MSPDFLRWLRGRNLSSDDRIMRLKEGYFFVTCSSQFVKLLLLFPSDMTVCTADTLRRAALWVSWVLFKRTTTCWWSFLLLNQSQLAASGPSASSRPTSTDWSWDATHLTSMWYQFSQLRSGTSERKRDVYYKSFDFWFVPWGARIERMCKCWVWLWLSTTISVVLYLGLGCIVLYVIFFSFWLSHGYL